MKKRMLANSLLLLAFLSVVYNSSAQLKVGRTKEQIATDKDKATLKLIGANNVLSAEYKLYRMEDSIEVFAYDYDPNPSLNLSLKNQHKTFSTGQVSFTSVSEEKEFYKYVLGLFDEFKDNEFTIGTTRFIPHKMGNFLGTKNLAFDIYSEGSSTPHQSLVIGKSGWERLFKKSIVHK